MFTKGSPGNESRGIAESAFPTGPGVNPLDFSLRMIDHGAGDRPGTAIWFAVWPARRHDDRHRVDDRLGHLHHFGGIGATRRRARLVVDGVGAGRIAHDHRRTLLRGAGGDDAEGGRPICLPARSLRPLFGFLFGWAIFLVVQTGTIAAVAVAFARFAGVFFPRIADRPITSSRRFISAAATRSAFPRNSSLAVAMILLLTWSNTRGLELGKLVQKSFHLRQDGRAHRFDHRRALARLERDECCAQLHRGGIHGERLAAASRTARPRCHRRVRALDVVRQGDGRPALRAIGLE